MTQFEDVWRFVWEIYCQALVETHGAAPEVEGFGTDSDPTITLSFPVEKSAHGLGGITAAVRSIPNQSDRIEFKGEARMLLDRVAA